MLWHKIWGSPQNPTLIFLHGFMGSHKDFFPHIEILQKNFYCIALDLPGHGNSTNFLPRSSEDFDDFIIQTLEPYINQEFTLIGYSMGGRIALRLAPIIEPSALVLISTLTTQLSKQGKKQRLKKDRGLTKDLQNLPFTSFLKNWYRIPLFQTLNVNSKLYLDMIEERKKQSPEALSHIMNLLSPAVYFVSENAIETLKAPLLYCCGAQDEEYFNQAKKLLEKKSDLWVASYSNASHATHLEYPKDFTQTLKQFYRYYYDRMERAPSI